LDAKESRNPTAHIVELSTWNIIKLPSHKKIEILTFVAKTKNSTNQRPDKFESYEIIREKQNDENSKILELRKFGNGRVEVGYQDLIDVGV
jgi:hypothetical protein